VSGDGQKVTKTTRLHVVRRAAHKPKRTGNARQDSAAPPVHRSAPPAPPVADPTARGADAEAPATTVSDQQAREPAVTPPPPPPAAVQPAVHRAAAKPNAETAPAPRARQRARHKPRRARHQASRERKREAAPTARPHDGDGGGSIDPVLPVLVGVAGTLIGGAYFLSSRAGGSSPIRFRH
jgi:hypothetical protein